MGSTTFFRWSCDVTQRASASIHTVGGSSRKDTSTAGPELRLSNRIPAPYEGNRDRQKSARQRHPTARARSATIDTGRPPCRRPPLLARIKMSAMRPTPARTESRTFRCCGIALSIIFFGAFALAFALKHAAIRVQMLNGIVILLSTGGLLLFCLHTRVACGRSSYR
jgi:hypothetical protein